MIYGGMSRGVAPVCHALLCARSPGSPPELTQGRRLHVLSTVQGCPEISLVVANSRAAFGKQTPTVAMFSPILRVPQDSGIYRTALNQQTQQAPQSWSQACDERWPGHIQHPEPSECLTCPWSTLMSPGCWEQRIQAMDVPRPTPRTGSLFPDRGAGGRIRVAVLEGTKEKD